MIKKNKIVILLCLVIIFEVVFYYLMNKIHSLDPNIIIFDIKLFYSSELFYENILLYTDEIKKYLKIFRLLDMFFPIIYTLLFIQLLRKFGSKHIIFPLIALFYDLSENILLHYIMFDDSYSGILVIYLINTITFIKFIAILATIVIIIYLFFDNRFIHKNRNKDSIY